MANHLVTDPNQAEFKKQQLDNIRSLQLFQWLTNEITVDFLKQINKMRFDCLEKAEVLAVDGAKDYDQINALLIRAFVYRQLIERHSNLLSTTKQETN